MYIIVVSVSYSTYDLLFIFFLIITFIEVPEILFVIYGRPHHEKDEYPCQGQEPEADIYSVQQDLCIAHVQPLKIRADIKIPADERNQYADHGHHYDHRDRIRIIFLRISHILIIA
jgi:hypothetical protein